MKKLLALVLAVCLLTSITASLALADEKTYDKKVTISWATIAATAGYDYSHGDDLASYWTDKFNFEWDVIPLDWSSWAETLRVWIASGDMPDMVTWNFDYSELASWVDQGLVYELPEGWKERWPGVAAATDAAIGTQVEEMLGGTYMLCRPTYMTNFPEGYPVTECFGVFIRSDWAEAVGFELKDYYTLTELEEYVRLVLEQNPGNVENLVGISMSTTQIFNLYMRTQWTNLNSFYIGEDGQYHWGCQDEEVLPALQHLKDAYTEGLIHPEYYLLDNSEANDLFRVNGTAAVCGWNLMPANWNSNTNEVAENLGAENAVHAAWIIAEDGKFHGQVNDNYWTCALFSPDIDEEVFERVMDIMEYSTTAEASTLVNLGFEGVDYTYDADGNFVSLLEAGTDINSKYKCQMPAYTNLLVLSDDFGLANPNFPEKFRDACIRYYKERVELSDETTLVYKDPTAMFWVSNAKTRIDALSLDTEFSQIMLQDGDLETNLNTWINDKLPLANQVISELNAQLSK